MKRICILGFGRLGRIMAQAILDHKVSEAVLAGVFCRSKGKPDKEAGKMGCTIVHELSEMLALRPDYVLEAAGPEALKEYTEPIIETGAGMIVLSTGVFMDDAFRERIGNVAEKHNTRIILAPGVLGGLDLVQAAAMMGNLEASLVKYRPGVNSDVLDPALQNLPIGVSDNCRSSYHKYPQHLNVAASLGMATQDPDGTSVKVLEGEKTGFSIQLQGAFGKAQFFDELGTIGPELAAWSAVACLKRQLERITF